MKILAVIPARMQATRFPNKPLAKIAGVPMIGHVYKRALLSKSFDEIYVATCDREIFDYATSIGGKAVMTLDTHERCTDRTAEALLKIEDENKTKYDIVGMVQGDEPLVVPAVFREAIECFKQDPKLPMVNIMGKIETEKEFNSPNVVKVVVDQRSHALYFSREPIPSVKKYKENFPKFKQTGMIFFKREMLLKFNEMTPTPLEKIESVDMMRILENGEKIKMVLTENTCLGVDVPEDVAGVESVLRTDELFRKYQTELQG